MYENILVIDTSASQCSIALRYKNFLFHHNQAITKDYSQTILPSLHHLLSEANAELSEISMIVYTEGPGSYTGLRIACSVIQGICFIYKTPVLAISSLALLAQGIYHQYGYTRVLATLNAYRQEVYWGYYEYSPQTHLMCAMIPDQVSSTLQIAPELLNHCVIAGDGWEAFKSSNACVINKSSLLAQPNALNGFDFAVQQAYPIPQPSIDNIVPIYLRGETEWKKSI
jgi:tRNA threonylcarbamoyladenosine biosynthesis protein TsaB